MNAELEKFVAVVVSRCIGADVESKISYAVRALFDEIEKEEGKWIPLERNKRVTRAVDELKRRFGMEER